MSDGRFSKAIMCIEQCVTRQMGNYMCAQHVTCKITILLIYPSTNYSFNFDTSHFSLVANFSICLVISAIIIFVVFFAFRLLQKYSTENIPCIAFANEIALVLTKSCFSHSFQFLRPYRWSEMQLKINKELKTQKILCYCAF